MNKLNIKPEIQEDIGYWFLMKKGKENYYSLGSKNVDRYISLSEKKLSVVLKIIKYFDGNHDLGWLKNYFSTTEGLDINIEQVYKNLAKAGLIKNASSGHEKSEIKTMGLPVLNLPIADISGGLRKFLIICWNLYLIIGFSLIAFAIFQVFADYSRLPSLLALTGTVNESYIIGFFLTLSMVVPSIFLHELSHAIAAIGAGLQPKRLSLSLYLGILPMWYVKIPGMYTVNQVKRLSIMIAGIFTNLVIFSLVIVSLLTFQESTLTQEFLMKLALANFYSALFALAPFSLSDGYFIFTTILKMPNLRLNLIKEIGAFFSKNRQTITLTNSMYLLIGLIIIIASVSSTYWWLFNIFYEVSGLAFTGIIKYYLALLLTIFLVATFFIKAIIRAGGLIRNSF